MKSNTINKVFALAILLGMCTVAGGVSITDKPFGAVAGDGKDDTAAIQSAINSLPNGGHVIIPEGLFNVSMVKGIKITQPNIKLTIRGELLVTTEGKESPECDNLFAVTGPYCNIIGQGGMIRGEAKPFIGGKCPTVHRTIQHPTFFYVSPPADRFVMENLQLRDAPASFIALIGVKDSRISNCAFEGGVLKNIKVDNVPTCSRYQGVIMISTTGLMIQGNHFSFYEGRGMFEWICASGSGRHVNTSIVGNVFEGGYDHAIYCSGLTQSVIANNTIRDSVATSIKIVGNEMIITGNSITNSEHGGISTRTGSGSIIANNAIYGFGHRAIGITAYGTGERAASPNTDNIVQGNILIGLNGKDKNVMGAIRIESAGEVSRCKVIDNIIHNTGATNSGFDSKKPGEPAIYVSSGKTSEYVTISGNIIHNAKSDGIVVKNLKNSRIKDNDIQTAGKAIIKIDCARIIERDNQVASTR